MPFGFKPARKHGFFWHFLRVLGPLLTNHTHFITICCPSIIECACRLVPSQSGAFMDDLKKKNRLVLIIEMVVYLLIAVFIAFLISWWGCQHNDNLWISTELLPASLSFNQTFHVWRALPPVEVKDMYRSWGLQRRMQELRRSWWTLWRCIRRAGSPRIKCRIGRNGRLRLCFPRF